jgi:uncharacterized Tic20 family protein
MYYWCKTDDRLVCSCSIYGIVLSVLVLFTALLVCSCSIDGIVLSVLVLFTALFCLFLFYLQHCLSVLVLFTIAKGQSEAVNRTRTDKMPYIEQEQTKQCRK